MASSKSTKKSGKKSAKKGGTKVPANITVPDDLRAALDAEPRAAEEFARLNALNRYAVLYRVHDAKRPETRARRIEQFVAMLARGERPYP